MFKQILSVFISWFGRLFRKPVPPRQVVFFEGDELPAKLPIYDLAVSREGDTLWTAGMACPCGCERRIEVMLLPEVKPRWDLRIDKQGCPSLHPSIWIKDGCKSHFWLKDGFVRWC